MDNKSLQFCFFGDSLIDRPSIVVDDPHYDLPEIGSKVEVKGHETAGFFRLLNQELIVTYPDWKFRFVNFARGGSTIKETLNQLVTSENEIPHPDVAFFCVGINDIWRKYQGRLDEAIDYNDFCVAYRELIQKASQRCRLVCCIGEPLVRVGKHEEEINGDLRKYNLFIKAFIESSTFGNVFFIDLFSQFERKSALLKAYNPDQTLWIDGVHLSDIGNVLAANTIMEFLNSSKITREMFRVSSYERSQANLRL